MQTNTIKELIGMLEAGFNSIGIRVPVIEEETFISVRDILVEVEHEILCYRASDIGEPYMKFPLDATQAAASTVCVDILTGIVTRAIESV